ncbi:hypothetical protein QBC37DRAFT_36803 [Rhypophila decipiens]|uniref:Uncharacterized protein n=1 Tax=Rhypophila decipiens TaxID=261697 RepID=A0AAN6Y106_9PEZI|nr:hypothetical protein QBC37DRAFT_36803 [Rhypophila decipiens]
MINTRHVPYSVGQSVRPIQSFEQNETIQLVGGGVSPVWPSQVSLQQDQMVNNPDEEAKSPSPSPTMLRQLLADVVQNILSPHGTYHVKLGLGRDTRNSETRQSGLCSLVCDLYTPRPVPCHNIRTSQQQKPNLPHQNIKKSSANAGKHVKRFANNTKSQISYFASSSRPVAWYGHLNGTASSGIAPAYRTGHLVPPTYTYFPWRVGSPTILFLRAG